MAVKDPSCVVAVYVGQAFCGSGVLIGPRHLLTCAHVALAGSGLAVGGARAPASLKQSDSADTVDLAVLELEKATTVQPAVLISELRSHHLHVAEGLRCQLHGRNEQHQLVSASLASWQTRDLDGSLAAIQLSGHGMPEGTSGGGALVSLPDGRLGLIGTLRKGGDGRPGTLLSASNLAVALLPNAADLGIEVRRADEAFTSVALVEKLEHEIRRKLSPPRCREALEALAAQLGTAADAVTVAARLVRAESCEQMIADCAQVHTELLEHHGQPTEATRCVTRVLLAALPVLYRGGQAQRHPAGATGNLLAVQAGNETLAEIAMSRLDERAPSFRDVFDPRAAPRGERSVEPASGLPQGAEGALDRHVAAVRQHLADKLLDPTTRSRCGGDRVKLDREINERLTWSASGKTNHDRGHYYYLFYGDADRPLAERLAKLYPGLRVAELVGETADDTEVFEGVAQVLRDPGKRS